MIFSPGGDCEFREGFGGVLVVTQVLSAPPVRPKDYTVTATLISGKGLAARLVRYRTTVQSERYWQGAWCANGYTITGVLDLSLAAEIAAMRDNSTEARR